MGNRPFNYEKCPWCGAEYKRSTVKIVEEDHTRKGELSASEFLDAQEKHLLKYLKSRPR